MIDSLERVPLRNWISFIALLIIQTQSGFNITSSQFLLVPMAHALHSDGFGRDTWWFFLLDSYQIVVTMLLLLPYILFSSVAGWIADRWSKNIVIQVMLGLQILALTIIWTGLKMQSLVVSTAGFFVLTLHAAFFSPAKLGIVKEFVGSKKLTLASGWMEMLVILGILAGTISMGPLFDHSHHTKGLSAWVSAEHPMYWLMIASLIAPLVFLAAERQPSHAKEPFNWDIFLRQIRDVKELFKERPLRLAALGVGFWWFFAGFVKLSSVQISDAVGQVTMGTELSLMMTYISVGIAIGSVIASWICWNRNELGLVPVGALGMSTGLAVLAFIPGKTVPFYTIFCISGALSALFLVPLNAFLQDEVPHDKRGRLLAASNLLNCVGGVFAAVIQGGIMWISLQSNAQNGQTHAAWSIPVQFLLLAGLSFWAFTYIMRLLPKHFFRLMLLSIVRFLYRVKVLHPERVPKNGGVLMVSNHVSYVDTLMIGSANERMVRFVIFDGIYNNPWLKWFYKIYGCVPISQTHAKEAIRTTAQAVKDGDLVCIFPEGMLTRTGLISEVKKGFEIIARQAGQPVVPVYLDGIWNSIFAFERGRYFTKWPNHIPLSVIVNIGEPIPAKDATMERLRLVWYQLGAESLANRVELNRTMAESLRKQFRGGKKCLALKIDQDWRFWSRREVGKVASQVAVSCAGLSQRIGVLPGAPSETAVLLLGLWLAGKTPVLLPSALAEDETALPAFAEKHKLGTLLKGHTDLSAKHWSPEIRHLTSPVPQEIATGIESSALECVVKSGQDWMVVSNNHRELLAMVAQIRNSHLIIDSEPIATTLPLDSLGNVIYGLLWPILNGIPFFLADEKITTGTIRGKTGPQIVDNVMTASLENSRFRLLIINSPSQIRNQKAVKTPLCPAWVDQEQGCLLTISVPNESLPTGNQNDDQWGTREGSVGKLLTGLEVEWSGALSGSIKVKGVTTGNKWLSIAEQAKEDKDRFLFVGK